MQPWRQLSPGTAPQLAQFVGRPFDGTPAIDFRSLPLTLNPWPLLFGKMLRVTPGPPPGNGYSHAAVGPDTNHITPRARVPDVIDISIDIAHSYL